MNNLHIFLSIKNANGTNIYCDVSMSKIDSVKEN